MKKNNINKKTNDVIKSDTKKAFMEIGIGGTYKNGIGEAINIIGFGDTVFKGGEYLQEEYSINGKHCEYPPKPNDPQDIISLVSSPSKRNPLDPIRLEINGTYKTRDGKCIEIIDYADNPFLGDDGKEYTIEGWTAKEEGSVRDLYEMIKEPDSKLEKKITGPMRYTDYENTLICHLRDIKEMMDKNNIESDFINIKKIMYKEPQNLNGHQFSFNVITELKGILKMLLGKNEKYGDSALNPTKIFSKENPIEQIKTRIDDKLARIKNQTLIGEKDDEDVVKDLIGYLILLRIATRKETKGNK